MTERMIENRIKKLRELEAQQKELEAAAEVIRAELKADLEEKGVDELKTKNFIVRWKEIISSRLDSKALKAALLSAPVRFCNFSPNVECKKMAGKGMQPLNDYTCRFRPSSLKCTDKSGLDGLQADK